MTTAVATREVAKRFEATKGLNSFHLTPKQNKYIMAFVRNGGNGAQAALEAYDCKDADSAATISTENLRRPQVKEALQMLLAEMTSPQAVLGKMSQLMHHAKREETQLDAAEDLAKINGMFIDKREVSTTVAVVQFGLPNHQKDQVIDITPRKLAKVSPD